MLVDELLDRIIVFPEHLEVVVNGVPKLNGDLNSTSSGAVLCTSLFLR